MEAEEFEAVERSYRCRANNPAKSLILPTTFYSHWSKNSPVKCQKYNKALITEAYLAEFLLGVKTSSATTVARSMTLVKITIKRSQFRTQKHFGPRAYLEPVPTWRPTGHKMRHRQSKLRSIPKSQLFGSSVYSQERPAGNNQQLKRSAGWKRETGRLQPKARKSGTSIRRQNSKIQETSASVWI